MNTKAIERIKGYCCEVTQEQWEELVSVAGAICLEVNPIVLESPFGYFGVFVYWSGSVITTEREPTKSIIPFPDFIAKLKGEEKWEPKAGEMVEFSDKGILWREREFIAKSRGKYVGWTSDIEIHAWAMCRPVRPTITRSEAEALLNKRIID